ncbi:MAG: tyrosine-type recombinase/integrase [Planctomycetota bacterium]
MGWLRRSKIGRKADSAGPTQAVNRSQTRPFDNDLAAAGIAKVDDQGRVVRLHPLRHTFAQMLNAASVDPKTLQTLMRHSSPTLSLGIYVHRDKSRERSAMAALPALTPGREDGSKGEGPASDTTARASSAS